MTVAILRKLRALMMRTMPLMITCRELDGFIVDYLENRLPEDQRRRFDLHLRMCRECRSYLESYKEVISLGKAAFEDPEGPALGDAPEELIEAILSARTRGV